MWLINTNTLTLEEFPNSNQRYAILSHTWGVSSEEVSYQEMMSKPRADSTTQKSGYRKIEKTCEIARDKYDLKYAWVDTCCIDKTSSAQLSEAINSMFRWYQEAEICMAYLSDLDQRESNLAESKWFTRGWTLQELIAPRKVVFFDKDWVKRGVKSGFLTGKVSAFTRAISNITKIPARVLTQEIELSEIPVAQRMAWASSRRTTRIEDLAYCLLGIFDINMPMLYGEGQKAFLRLQEEIIKESADMSIFYWSDRKARNTFSGLLARSPALFQEAKVVPQHFIPSPPEFSLNNRGIRFRTSLACDSLDGTLILPLNHGPKRGESRGLALRQVGVDLYVRDDPDVLVRIGKVGPPKEVLIMKSVTPTQSDAIFRNILRVQIDCPDYKLDKVIPVGCWSPESPVICAGFSGAFLGYISFNKPGLPSEMGQFALICCFRNGSWGYCLVFQNEWQNLEPRIYDHFRDDATKLASARLSVDIIGFKSSEMGWEEIKIGTVDVAQSLLEPEAPPSLIVRLTYTENVKFIKTKFRGST